MRGISMMHPWGDAHGHLCSHSLSKEQQELAIGRALQAGCAFFVVRPAGAMNLGVQVPCGPRSWEPLAKSKGVRSDSESGGRKR